MRYIIMCGGIYSQWEIPRQLTPIMGEAVVERTIRLLKEAGATDICISSNDPRFEAFGVPMLRHKNTFHGFVEGAGSWVEAFYPMREPACYLMGDVVFSPEAIRTIVDTHVDGIQFFASRPPFPPEYIKPYAEPFAFKVVDQKRFREAIEFVKDNESTGIFRRRPIAWELWQVINDEDVWTINYHNYVAINDYTCDIDKPSDARLIELALKARGIKA